MKLPTRENVRLNPGTHNQTILKAYIDGRLIESGEYMIVLHSEDEYFIDKWGKKWMPNRQEE